MTRASAVDQYAAVTKEMLQGISKVVGDSRMSSSDKLKSIEAIASACKEIAEAHVYMSGK